MNPYRITVSLFVHISMFLILLLGFYLVSFGNHNDQEIQDAYTGAIEDVIGEKLKSIPGVPALLAPMVPAMKEARSVFENQVDPEKAYNDLLSGVISAIIILTLVIAIAITAVIKDWRMFGFVLLENLYVLVVLFAVLAVFYTQAIYPYKPVTPSDIANDIVKINERL